MYTAAEILRIFAQILDSQMARCGFELFYLIKLCIESTPCIVVQKVLVKKECTYNCNHKIRFEGNIKT